MFDFLQDLTNLQKLEVALGVGLVCGLFFGYFLSKESVKRRAIHGGPLAHLFHYLGASMVGTILPMVVIGLLEGLRFVSLFLSGLGFMAATAVFMILYGFFESRAEPVEIAPVRELD